MKKMSEVTIVVIIAALLQIMVAGAMFKMHEKTMDEMASTYENIRK